MTKHKSLTGFAVKGLILKFVYFGASWRFVLIKTVAKTALSRTTTFRKGIGKVPLF